MATEYHVYTNTGAGDPINYATPVATLGALTWTTAGLSYPATWSFGVRAFDTVSGLEEQNLDCSVTVILDSAAHDITNQPFPPTGVRAIPLPGGSIRVEWPYPVVNRANIPTGFHVYIGADSTPNYSTPAATVSFSTGTANTFAVNITGLSSGTTYSIGVRAFNSVTEEQNTSTVSCMADSVGPSPVVSLSITAT